MRNIDADLIAKAVRDLFLTINREISPDIRRCVEDACRAETSPQARYALEQIVANYDVAGQDALPLCQDTGMAVVFAEIGQDVHINGDFEAAVDRGVREAYSEGSFRCSVVKDPVFDRENTRDNCPAIVHVRLTQGESIRLTAIAKGFGSENMSRIHMLSPAYGAEGVLRAIVDTVREAGPNPCPPVIVGVGVGGDFEQAALLAKLATARPVGVHHEDKRYSDLEARALKEINALGIGAAGLYGRTTALWVAVEHAPTHIAGLPVAVNICCHASRHKRITL